MNSEKSGVFRCESCGQLNRVTAARSAEGSSPRCGRCKEELSLEPHPAMLTDQDFGQFVSAPIPVLVDFWAPWCGPCHALAPTIEQLSAEFAGRILVGKLNTDDNQSVAGKLGIRGIPTVIIFRDGQELDRLVGVQPKGEFARRIQSLLQS